MNWQVLHLLHLLLLLLLMWSSSSFVAADWVEIPQFSDQHRVYRIPSNSRPYHHRQQDSDRRIYVADDRYGQQGGFRRQESSLRNISRFPTNPYSTYPHDEPPFAGTISTFTTERVYASVEIEDSDRDEAVVVESAEDDESRFEEVPVLYHSSEEVTTTFKSDTAVPFTTVPPKPSKLPPNLNKTKDDKGFFDYLPVDLLKKVHKTLKSQPPTLRGKIRFLKAFERTLIEEIENRLSTALAPTRKTRGARGHDSRDEGLGFPSLEGALMAISFLTFAVYLIRLVMLLFRNAALNGTTPIFIGRKKRSIDEYSEQAARILSYLDSSSEEYYKSQKQFSRLKH